MFPTYHLLVEDIEPNHYVAYVVELPGCFGNGRTKDAALGSVPARIASRLGTGGQVQLEVAEEFSSWISEGDYRVNAFFEADRPALTAAEIKEGLALLRKSRHSLLQVVARVPGEAFDQPEERAAHGSITGTLLHIANAEAWYFHRLDKAPDRDRLPEDPIHRLESVRALTLAMLPTLDGDASIVELQGEQWSVRKVLRRTLWHEADHTNQIEKIIRGDRS